MRRFRLYMALSSGGCVVFPALFGYGLHGGVSTPLLCLAAIMSAACVALVWHLSRKAIRQTMTFAKALEMKDFTLRFAESDDKEINAMNESMNRIIALYRDGTNALETRKLYYDRILRVMTHELRNSITPICSLAEDMTLHPERYDGQNLMEALSVISYESNGIKHFLDSYYELTHLPRPEKKHTDAVTFFTKVRQTFLLKAGEAGLPESSISFAIAAGMTIDIDEALMHRVLTNLLTNALDAVKGVAEPAISVTASLPEWHPYITVSDNGCGMTPQTLDNIFQPFFTTKPEGNGIGLCLSRQIVRLHEGDIRVNSTPGHGTTFHITLP